MIYIILGFLFGFTMSLDGFLYTFGSNLYDEGPHKDLNVEEIKIQI